jgi:hypothetical protein
MPSVNERLIQDKVVNYDSIPEFRRLYKEAQEASHPFSSNPNDSSGHEKPKSPAGPAWSLASELSWYIEKLFSFVWAEALVLLTFHEIDARTGCKEPSIGQSWYYDPIDNVIAPPSVIFRRARYIKLFCPRLIPKDQRDDITELQLLHHINNCITEFGGEQSAEDYYQIIRALRNRHGFKEGEQDLARIVAYVCRKRELLELLYDKVPEINEFRHLVEGQVYRRHLALTDIEAETANFYEQTDIELSRVQQTNELINERKGPVDWTIPAHSYRYERFSEVQHCVPRLRGDPFGHRRGFDEAKKHTLLRKDLLGFEDWGRDEQGKPIKFPFYFRCAFKDEFRRQGVIPSHNWETKDLYA